MRRDQLQDSRRGGLLRLYGNDVLEETLILAGEGTGHGNDGEDGKTRKAEV
jgi:hypothetical protein